MRQLFTLLALILAPVIAAATDYSLLRQSVYPVLVYSPTNQETTVISSGSVVMLAPKYAITAAHVVPVTPRQPMYVIKNSQAYRATPIKIDRTADLALLLVELDCPCLPLADSAARIDEQIFSVGFPMYLSHEVQFLTTGTVQGMYDGKLVSTGITAPGGSGGALVAFRSGSAQLVGVNVAIATNPVGPRILGYQQEYNWVTFSVPTQTIRAFLKGTLMDKEKAR